MTNKKPTNKVAGAGTNNHNFNIDVIKFTLNITIDKVARILSWQSSLGNKDIDSPVACLYLEVQSYSIGYNILFICKIKSIK